MKKRKPPGRRTRQDDQPRVVRRSASDRKKFPDDLDAFAKGDDDALWRRRATRGRVRDPRAIALIPGVANRDARSVYEARIRRIRRAMDNDERDLAARELAEAKRLQLWRGNNIMGWAAFVQHVLDLDLNEANELCAAGETQIDSLEPPDEAIIAMWMRAEAGLLEVTPNAKTSLVGAPGEERLILEVSAHVAPIALAAVGRRSTPLARDLAENPETVVDRPLGMPRISKLVERDMKGDDD